MSATSHPSQTTPSTGRAVVLGGSLAGLLAARVLADHYAEVLVVDRDDIALAGDDTRRGVPHSTQVHGLLMGGLGAIERLLPGYSADVAARGASVGDVVSSAAWWFPYGRLAHPPSGMTGVAASRPFLEGEVRRRVMAIGNVRIRGGTDVAGVVASADRTRVVGARIVDRTPGAAATSVPADLVVDATGRGSRTPTWLEDLGYPAPPEDTLDLGISYSSRLFGVRPDHTDLNACVVTLRPPEPRTGVLLRQEGNCWIVTLAARLGEVAPTDLDDFRAFARGLPAPEIGHVATTGEPIGDATTFRFPTSRWRHYERCDRLPEGLVVLGDAVCSFDPTFAQGMSSAAMQVEVLQRELATGRDGLERRVAAGAAGVAGIPWTLVSGTVRRLPGMPPKSFAERLLDRYLARLMRVATTDGDVAIEFLRVVNLVAPPTGLLAPHLARRVLLARRAPAGSGPAEPADVAGGGTPDLGSPADRLVG